MTDLIVLPDGVEPTIAWLNGLTQVTALVGHKIGVETPPKEDWPAVRLDLIPGSTPIEWRLNRARFQVQSFDPDKLRALLIARTVRAGIVAMVGHFVPGEFCVTDVVTSSPFLITDRDREPRVAHASFSAEISFRPDP